jgi:hypothetical protein
MKGQRGRIMNKRIISIVTALVFVLGTAYFPTGYAVEMMATEPTTEATTSVTPEATEAPEAEEGMMPEPTGVEFKDVKIPKWVRGTNITIETPNIKTDRTTEPAILEGTEKVPKSRSGIKATRSSYDPRNEKWYLDNKKIKDQDGTGLCWACAAATVAEMSYCRETGNPVPELAAAHLGYFLYNRVDDPLGNTGGDKNIIGTPGRNWASIGGNDMYTNIAMSSWTGMAEYKDIYNMWEIYQYEPYPDDDAYNNEIVLEEAKLINAINEADTDDRGIIEAARQNIKNAIVDQGAVVSGIFLGDFKHIKEVTIKEGTPEEEVVCTCNNNKELDADHAITVIGWDDNFSRDYFYHNEDENVDFRPEKDGAWLIQNSWGITENKAKPRYEYIWVSYEDKGFAFLGTSEGADGKKKAVRYVTSYDMQLAEIYDYNYQYDGTAGDRARRLFSGDKVANIYDVKPQKGTDPQLLEAIGLVTNLDGESSFKIDIYKNVDKSKDPESGENVYSGTFDTDKAGFYTVPLEGKNVPLCRGENYSVVITAQKDTWLGIERDLDSGWIKFDAELQNGQSYYSKKGGSWEDAAEQEWCARIKGFANDNILKPQGKVNVKLYDYNDIHVSWTKQAVKDFTVKYKVEYMKSGGQYSLLTNGTTNNYYKKANLEDGAKYKFRVTPYIIKDGKTYSGAAGYSTDIYTLKKINTPKVSKSSKKYVKVEWTNIPGESGYQIARSCCKNKKFSIVKTVSYKNSSTKIKTKRYKKYYYKVRAYKTVDGKRIYGPWSSVKRYKLK